MKKLTPLLPLILCLSFFATDVGLCCWIKFQQAQERTAGDPDRA